MSAGQSAYNVARRQREEAERLQRSAALWERGAQGEEAVARSLADLPDEWVVLHDLAWPGRQRANLDHVVVGPGGVFVVDAKNWSGRIEVRDQVLRQNGRRREDAVSSVTAAAIAVQALVSPHSCRGVLCFVRDEEMTATSWNVTVCSTANLATMLTSRPPELGPDEVNRCVEAIRLGAVRPSPGTTSTSNPDHPTARREAPKKWRGRPVAVVVGAAVLVAAALGGGLATAGEWVGERVVEVVAPGDPGEPTPSQPARQRQQKQQKKENKQRDGQQGQRTG
jgi:hypothetical protein